MKTKSFAILSRFMQQAQNLPAIPEPEPIVVPVEALASSPDTSHRGNGGYGMNNGQWRDGVRDLERQIARGIPIPVRSVREGRER